ncbi:TIGR02569 family protein [Corynebacterium variabile]|uniref:TIGR02569 family protein n=1 Tax=Corynebacterium variabile TaxID=1727 RepID=UPI003FD5A3B2
MSDSNRNTAPTEGVRGAFQVGYVTPVLLGDAWGDGWRCDHVVLVPVSDPARGTWVAQVMDRIRPAGVTVPRPLRSTDGRYSVGGWTARAFVSGHRAPRFDEVAAAAVSLNKALAEERRPSFLTGGSTNRSSASSRDGVGDVDLFAAAEAAAWADDPTDLLAPVMDPGAVPREDVAAAMAKAAKLLPLRAEVTAPDQLVHGDMLGCTVFDGHTDPAVVDLVPAWRPAVWSVALLVVDAVAWASAEDDLIDRWSHLPDFNQLLLRAVIYRMFVHAVLPDSQPEAWPGLERVSDIVAVRITGRSGRDDMISDDLSDDGTGEQGTENTCGGQDRQDGQD